MRQDVYRVALDEAHAELIGISKRFEDLRQRKESLESVVAALGPMLGIAAALPSETQQRLATPAAELSLPEPQASPEPQAPAEPADYTFNQVPAPLPDESVNDPFQRRVRNALKFSSGNGNNSNNNGHDRRGLQTAV
jgi:hypothetical protein